MPCNSDYANPTERESRRVNAAALLLVVYKRLNTKAPSWIYDSARNIYGENKEDKDPVQHLCDLLSDMSKDEIDKLMYSNSKDKDQRALANWWEQHQKDDAKRLKLEQEQKERKKLKKQALSKLSSEEKKALGL